MTRDEIQKHILRIFHENFEIESPGLDEDLREVYEFDSIDAIELLREIEIMLSSELSRAEKKNAMDIRTMNQIINYIVVLKRSRTEGKGPGDPAPPDGRWRFGRLIHLQTRNRDTGIGLGSIRVPRPHAFILYPMKVLEWNAELSSRPARP